MAIRDLIPWNGGHRDIASRRGSQAMQALHSDIDRLFEDFFHMADLPGIPMLDHELASAAAVDVRDAGKEIEVKAELPGLKEEDIEVTVSDGALLIRGEKKDEREQQNAGYMLRERSFGRIERMIPLPDGVDSGAAHASFKHGVLTVTIPKTAQAQSAVKKIAVQGG
jgi:HSP20 family protein